LQATQELFETLVLMRPVERDSFLAAHPELPPSTVRRALEMLTGDDDSFALPPLDHLLQSAADERAMELQAGDLFGAYRLIRRMGSGGMGVVYEAVREEGEIRLRVAMKVLHPELCTPEFLLQMRQEASKLSKLRHPNIARLLDWKLDTIDTPYCVLEYIDGEKITSWCRIHAQSLQVRLRIFLDVCTAVAFAHRNMIAHLDLKPENILINASGGVRLVDFGISRTLTQERVMGGDTQLRAYSARYASPEQIHGGQLSASSDIYSLGIVLRDLLSEPFVKETKDAASKPLPYELEAIAAHASAAEPESRYATVDELQQDLRNYLAKRPVSAVPRTPLYLARQFCRRNAWQLAGASVMGIALAASLAAWLIHRQEDREHKRAEQLRESVHQLSSTLLFPLEDEMRDLPGATPARNLAVQTGLQFLQNLAAEANGDPTLKMEIGKAYTKLGDIQGNPGNANLGDEKGAMVSYETARQLLANLRDPEGRYTYGVLLAREGILVGAEGNKQAEEQKYQEAILDFRVLSNSSQADARVKDSLQSTMVYLADLQSADGHDDLARANYIQAVDLARQLVQQQPENVVYQRSLARCASRLGNLEWNAGDWQQALNAYRGSFDVYDRLLRQQPDNIKVRHSWIAGANNVAATDEQLNRPTEALDLYTRAEALASRDAEIDPHDTQAMRDQQVDDSNLTRVYLRLGKLAKAEDSCRRELAIAQVLWKLNPQDAMAKDDLAGSEEHLAEVQGKRHDFRAAIASEEKALHLLHANLRANDSAESLVAVVDGLLRLANYNLDLGASSPSMPEAARQAAVQSLAELHRLQPRLRPGYAEDKERATKIRKLEARLRIQPR
jgi:serine/threonine protein kinase